MAFTFKHGDQPLEGYTVQRGVGRGGFGEVYYALSAGGKEVALKYLRDNPQVELRGVSHCINLKSPHLVTIFDVKPNAEGEYFIIMEYVSGPSLRDLLIAEPAGLGLQKAAFFAREIGKGLGYLHDRGIIHRDLKPGNIFYEDGYVKIGDYGLAKFISVSRHSGQTASVGTVHYMAPEVGTGNYHRGIDIYALGVILYEMLLGKVPFEGSTMGEVLMKHLTQQPEVDQLLPPFASVIRKALAKDPNERYQTVDEMVSEIFTEDQVRRSVAAFEPASIKKLDRHAMETQAIEGAPNTMHRVWEPQSPRRSPARAEPLRERHPAAGPYPPPPPAAAPLPVAPQAEPAAAAAPTEREGSMLGRSVLAILIVAGLTALVGGLSGTDPSLIVLAYGFIIAMSGGAAIAYKVLSRMPAPEHAAWVTRLVTLGCAAGPVSAVGGIAIAAGHNPRLLPVALAMTLCIDWTKRIYHGLQGRLVKSEALLAALCGLVLTAILINGRHNGDYKFLMAAVGAATSIGLQAGGWLFMRRRPGEDQARLPVGEWHRHERSFLAPSRAVRAKHLKRYFESLGYGVEEKSRRQLKLTRGAKAAVMWGGDIRTYATELHVRVEDAPSRMSRVRCQYQVWTDRSTLRDEQIGVLDAEITHLARSVGAVEAEPAAHPAAPFPAASPVVAGNWPPPPPPAAQALLPPRRPRSTFARVFWSLATAGLVSAGVSLIVSSAFADEEEMHRASRQLAEVKKHFELEAPEPPAAPKPTRRTRSSTRQEDPMERARRLKDRLESMNLDQFMRERWREPYGYRAEQIIRRLEAGLSDYEIRRDYAYQYSDAGGMLAGGLACLAFSLFTFSKTTRYKRHGVWRETFRPFALCACLAGIGGAAGQLGMGHLPDHEMAPFIAAIIFCGLSFLLLLAIRGRAESATYVACCP